MKIVEYSEELKHQVIHLIITIQTEEFGLSITVDDQPDLESVEEFYIASGGGFWVALIGTEVVGTIALIYLGEDKYALRKMFVRKNCRGSGKKVAENLLKTAEGWVQQNNGSEILLGTTDKFLAAHKFYCKNNYKKISVGDLPECFPIMKVDTLFFSKKL